VVAFDEFGGSNRARRITPVATAQHYNPSPGLSPARREGLSAWLQPSCRGGESRGAPRPHEDAMGFPQNLLKHNSILKF